METVFPPPSAASDPDPARHQRAATPAHDLQNFRRYVYWSQVSMSVGLLGFLLVTGRVPVSSGPLGPAAVLGVAATGAAVVRLTAEQVSPPGDLAEPLLAGSYKWVVFGGLGALVVAARLASTGEAALWAYAPALIASLFIASLSAPRTKMLAALATIGAAATAGFLIGVVKATATTSAFALGGATVTAVVLLLTLVTIWTWNVALQLDEARRGAATLAVAKERLRFAGELHDIQGHHLQAIALKSELAARLVQKDPQSARQEIVAVQQLAATALRDTRAVVDGYRQISLDTEIGNASAVLNSAGIKTTVHVDPRPKRGLSDNGRRLLGLTVREAVTNVLRHSNAREAEIHLSWGDPIRLKITNDGTDHAPERVGGLHDLASRVHSARGTLTWHRNGDRFELCAELPREPADAAAVPNDA